MAAASFQQVVVRGARPFSNYCRTTTNYAQRIPKRFRSIAVPSPVVRLASAIQTRSLQTPPPLNSYDVVPPANPNIVVMEPSEDPDELPPMFTKLNITMKSHDYAVLDSYVEFIVRAGKMMEFDISGRVPLPTKRKRWTLLKSAHVHKQHRSKYQSTTHKRLVQIRNVNGIVAERFMDYVMRMIPPGVHVRLIHESLEEIPPEVMTLLPHLNEQASDEELYDVVLTLDTVLDAEQMQLVGDALADFDETGDVDKCNAALQDIITKTKSSEHAEKIATMIQSIQKIVQG
eukprot:m.339188 g.339188  ORF g.339188 m.339188 type:complete len:288 (-) comp18701_c0_seq1:53-916(-)